MSRVLEMLLIATGFTGGLTLLWLVRLLRQAFHFPQSVTAHFSPGGGCTDILVREIGAARREILVLAHRLASRPIAQALVEARLRGVNVEIIVDPINESAPQSELPFLCEQGLIPLLDTEHAGTDNRVILLDGKTVLTGSFDLTYQGETERTGSLLVVRGHPELAAAFHREFQTHRAHAHPSGAPSAALAAPVPPAPPQRRPADEILAAAAVPEVPLPATEDEPAVIHPEPESEPMVTPAAAELFARLRKQLAESATEEEQEQEEQEEVSVPGTVQAHP